MELLQLRYFYESAINESFSKTAKAHMVPSTSVSASIKRLEQELGCELFVRSSNRVHLNDDGRRFYESIRDLLLGLDEAVGSLQQAKEDLPVHLLVLDLRPPITRQVIRFQEENPKATFYMTMSRKNADPEDYDIIIDEECDRYPGRAVEPLKEYKLRFCASEKNPVTGHPVRLRDLANENFIGYEEEGNMYRRMVKTCVEAGFEPRILSMCNDVRCFHMLLSAGGGLALVKGHGKPVAGTKFIDVVDFDQTIRYAAYYRPGTKNKRVREFVELLKKTYGRI